MKKFWIGKIVVMVLLFITVVSSVLMLLWNWLMPYLFSLPEITFLQAAGLLLLSKILFGLGKGGGPGKHGPPWKQHFQNKWNHMPEEQREKWKKRFADKWCPMEEEPKDVSESRDKE